MLDTVNITHKFPFTRVRKASDTHYNKLIETECVIRFDKKVIAAYILADQQLCKEALDFFLTWEPPQAKNKMIIPLPGSSDETTFPILRKWYWRLNEICRNGFPELNQPLFDAAYFFRDIDKPYHFDTVMEKGSYTAVLTLRYNCSGGVLVIPEYQLGIAQDDSHLCLLDGSILHGVTPIHYNNDKAYRLNLVFYTKKRAQ